MLVGVRIAPVVKSIVECTVGVPVDRRVWRVREEGGHRRGAGVGGRDLGRSAVPVRKGHIVSEVFLILF